VCNGWIGAVVGSQDQGTLFCRSTVNPSWRQIALAIRRLDRRYFHRVNLVLADDAEGNPQGNLAIEGGAGKYHVRGILAGQRNTRSYHDPAKRGRGHTRYWEWGDNSGCSLEEEHLCDDVQLVLRIARHFAEHGALLPDVKWKCV
jgi:hypothetical protein